MTTPKGYSSQCKEDRLKAEFTTVQPITPDRFGMETVANTFVFVVATDTVDSYANAVITANGHSAIKGDVIKFTSGALDKRQFVVWDTSANTITLAQTPDTAPSAADSFSISRYTPASVTAAGGLSVATTFTRDGASQEVIEDTVVPANNRPLPVKITGLDGDVVINSSNLNLEVQLTDKTADYDAVRIGDGTDLLAIAADGSIAVTDNGASLTVDGTVAATQSGAWNIGTVATITNVVHVDDNGGALTVDGTVTIQDGGNTITVDGAVTVSDGGGSITVDGTVAATQSGGWDIGTLSTITNVVHVDDNGGALTVDGTVAVSKRQWAKAEGPYRNDYTSTAVTTAAYTQLDASTAADIYRLQIFDSSGQTMKLATGGAGAEADILYIPPGGIDIDFFIASGTRLSLKAVSATASVGEIVINALT